MAFNRAAGVGCGARYNPTLMLQLNPDKNWIAWLFIGAFALVVLYALWPYILATVIVVALVKGFSSQRHQSKHSNRRRCPRCRR